MLKLKTGKKNLEQKYYITGAELSYWERGGGGGRKVVLGKYLPVYLIAKPQR